MHAAAVAAAADQTPESLAAGQLNRCKSPTTQEFLDDDRRNAQGSGVGLPLMPFGQANGLPPLANSFAENSGTVFGMLGGGGGPLPMVGSLPNDMYGMRKQSFQHGGATMSLPLGMGLGGMGGGMGAFGNSAMHLASNSGASPGQLGGGGGMGNGLHSMGSAPLPMGFKGEQQQLYKGGAGGGGRVGPQGSANDMRSLSDQSAAVVSL